MAETTGIAWCDHTFNPWWGCTKIDAACDNCYAADFATRYGFDVWGEGKGKRLFGDKHWQEPLKWNAQAEKEGRRHRVFCASMADWADDEAPPGLVDRLWALVRATPWLDWQMLTKRANRIRERLPSDWGDGYPNVWLGVTVGNQKGIWRLRHLREIPAAVRFVSYEPALEKVDFGLTVGDPIHWIICGAESGPKRRPMDPEWARSARDQCADAGVNYFLKQFVDAKSGKKYELPVLDGRQHTDFPAADGDHAAALPAGQAQRSLL